MSLMHALWPQTKPPTEAERQHLAARLAGEKRQMERRLRAGGLSRAEAKKRAYPVCTQDHYQQWFAIARYLYP